MSNNVNQEMCSAFFSLGRIMRERGVKLLHESPLTFPLSHIETLHFIVSHRVVKMTDLAEYLHIKPPSVTALVNQMIKTELIERAANGKDRRAVILKITPLGKKMIKQRANMANEIIQKSLSALTKLEQETLLKILKKIVKNF